MQSKGPKINLEHLAAPFESLRWKVSSYNKEKTKCMLVPYLDSRDVQARLDAVVGPMNWWDEYRITGEDLYCYLSIRYDPNTVVTKSDCGEAEGPNEDTTGRAKASNAFKRAAVKWGIGRYIYGIKPIWVTYSAQLRHVLSESGEIVYDLDKFGMNLYGVARKGEIKRIYADLKSALEGTSIKSMGAVYEIIAHKLGIQLEGSPWDYWPHRESILAALLEKDNASSKT